MTMNQTDRRTALDEMSKRATPGPWAAESEKSEGSYGSGEDTSDGYDTATIVTEAEIRHGAPGVLFESHNSTVGSIAEEHDDEWFRAWDEVSEANAKFIVALVNAYRAGELTAPPRPDHAGGVETYRHGWCQPGDQPKRHWIVKFEDTEKGEAVFTDETEARKFFEQADGGGWNCWLFAAVPRSPAQAPDKAAEREGVDTSQVRQALQDADWSGVSIGNKCLVAAAIDALAPKPTGTEAGRGVGAETWGIEDTGDAIWVGPMRPDGIKVDRVVYFKDDLGLHRQEYVAQVKADARLICDSINRALTANPTPPTPDNTAQGDGTSQEGGRPIGTARKDREILLYGTLGRDRTVRPGWYIGKWDEACGVWTAHAMQLHAFLWADLPPVPADREGGR